MSAKSQKQRRLMAAAEHGATFPLAEKIRESMTHSQMHDFAATPEKNLPTTVPNSKPATPTRGEAVPGLMATRQNLRGIRNDSIRHIKKSGR